MPSFTRFLPLSISGYLIVFLFATLITPVAVRAQTWQQVLSGNVNQPRPPGTSETMASVSDAAGNVFITGRFNGSVTFGTSRLNSNGQWDMFLAKWNNSSQSWAWATSGGGAGDDVGNGVAVSNGSVYVTGNFESSRNCSMAGRPLPGAGGMDGFVVKYTDNALGFTNGWATSVGGPRNDESSSIAATGTGIFLTGFYITDTNQPSVTIAGTVLSGAGPNPPGPSLQMYVAKFIDNGSSFSNGWAVTGVGDANHVGRGVAVSGTSVYVLGNYNPTGLQVSGATLNGPGRIFLAKYTDLGNSAGNGWAISAGGINASFNLEESRGLAVSGDQVYITGYFYGSAVFANTNLLSQGLGDLFLAKYVDNGSTCTGRWAVSGGGYRSDAGQAIAISNGSVYVTGWSECQSYNQAYFAGQRLSGTGGHEVFVAKYLDNGASYSNGWAASGGSPDYLSSRLEGGFGLTVHDNTVYMAGSTANALAKFGSTPELVSPANAAVLGMLDAGTGVWQRIDGPLQGGTSRTYSTSVTNQGDVLVAGSFSGTVAFGKWRLSSAGGKDMFLAKWNPAAGAWVWAASNGGPGDDEAQKVVVQGADIYMAGSFTDSVLFAGVPLRSAGSTDAFLAKYTDAGSGLQRVWVVRGGGSEADEASSLTVSGGSVFVTGTFTSGSNAQFAGTSLAGAGRLDMFLAKYTDAGATCTPVGAVSGGGGSVDRSHDVAVSGTSVYVTGQFTTDMTAPTATISGTDLVGRGGADIFVAKYTSTNAGFSNGWATPGGGSLPDVGLGIAVAGNNVYVTGYCQPESYTQPIIAGTVMTWRGGRDIFIAKYLDNGSTFTNAWCKQDGGATMDQATDILVRGNEVYTTGAYTSTSNFSSGSVISGQSLTGRGGLDLFIAKYLDVGTGLQNMWAVRGGGQSDDLGASLVVHGGAVYVAGYTNLESAVYGSIQLNNTECGELNFLGHLNDATALNTREQVALKNQGALRVFPNPASDVSTVAGALPGAIVQVFNTLGQLQLTAKANKEGEVLLSHRLVQGMYLIYSGGNSSKLVVQ